MVLLASALKLLGASNLALVVILAVVMLALPLLWMYLRTRQGLPARSRILAQVRGQHAARRAAADLSPRQP